MQKIIFRVFIILEIAVWPIGIWMMVTGQQPPDTIGRAMATVILVLAIPIFAAS